MSFITKIIIKSQFSNKILISTNQNNTEIDLDLEWNHIDKLYNNKFYLIFQPNLQLTFKCIEYGCSREYNYKLNNEYKPIYKFFITIDTDCITTEAYLLEE